MKSCISIFAVLIFICSPLFAQETQPAGGSFHADLLWSLDDARNKLISLAEAVPAEKYSWRPAEGVRSVGEVYMHVVLANYGIPEFIGTKPPFAVSREMEKISDKAKVVEHLTQSFAHFRKVLEATPESDLDRRVKLFGQERSVRAVLILMTSHAHEHLGQSIAYARSNGVTPPWSASQ